MTKIKELSFEYLDLFASFFMLLLVTWILIVSVIYWSANLPVTSPEIFWWMGLGIAVMTVCGEWISGRLQAINRVHRNLKRIRQEWK